MVPLLTHYELRLSQMLMEAMRLTCTLGQESDGGVVEFVQFFQVGWSVMENRQFSKVLLTSGPELVGLNEFNPHCTLSLVKVLMVAIHPQRPPAGPDVRGCRLFSLASRIKIC